MTRPGSEEGWNDQSPPRLVALANRVVAQDMVLSALPVTRRLLLRGGDVMPETVTQMIQRDHAYQADAFSTWWLLPMVLLLLIWFVLWDRGPRWKP